METRAVVREPHVGDVPVELEPVARCARGIDVAYLPARRDIGGPARSFPDDHVDQRHSDDRDHTGGLRHDEPASKAVASELSTTRLLA